MCRCVVNLENFDVLQILEKFWYVVFGMFATHQNFLNLQHIYTSILIKVLFACVCVCLCVTLFALNRQYEEGV